MQPVEPKGGRFVWDRAGGLWKPTRRALLTGAAALAAATALPGGPALAQGTGFFLAAAFGTVSGGVVTLQKSQNVSSIVKNSTGQFTVNFARALPNANYGVLSDCLFPYNGGFDAAGTCAPNRDSSAGHNAYSTTQLDLLCWIGGGMNAAVDPQNISLIVYDPGISASGVQASVNFTISGGVCTMQRSVGMSGVAYIVAGVYEFDFSPTLSRSDYSALLGARLPTASGAGGTTSMSASIIASPTGRNFHSTTQLSMGAMGGNLSAPTEMAIGSGFVIDANSPPTGVLAAARLSYTSSGAAPTVARSFNINGGSSVCNNGSPGGNLSINLAFSSALANTNYGVICTGVSSGTYPAKAYERFYSGGVGSVRTTTNLSISLYGGSGPVDVIVFDAFALAPSASGTTPRHKLIESAADPDYERWLARRSA